MKKLGAVVAGFFGLMFAIAALGQLAHITENTAAFVSTLTNFGRTVARHHPQIVSFMKRLSSSITSIVNEAFRPHLRRPSLIEQTNRC